MFKKLLCFLNLHKWFTFYIHMPRIVQRCQRCGQRRSTMYDMAYGGTYWVPGDEWSKRRR